MRTDVKVGGNTVLAVVLGDIAKVLTHPITTIRRAITAEKLGEVFIVKDFLNTGEISTNVVRNQNNKRRKCNVIYLSKVDDDLREKLLDG